MNFRVHLALVLRSLRLKLQSLTLGIQGEPCVFLCFTLDLRQPAGAPLPGHIAQGIGLINVHTEINQGLTRLGLAFDAYPRQLLDLTSVPFFALGSTQGPARGVFGTLYGLPELSRDDGISLLEQCSEACAGSEVVLVSRLTKASKAAISGPSSDCPGVYELTKASCFKFLSPARTLVWSVAASPEVLTLSLKTASDSE